MKKFYILLLLSPMCSFSQIAQVKDIFPGSSAAVPPVVNSGSPNNLVNYNGTLLFRATDATNGSEFWKSDGTNAGTILVKDINTAVNANGNPANFISFNGNAFFSATTGTTVTGTELYKTDGTAAGTVLVKDINTGTASGNPQNMVVINPTTMLFSAIGATTGNELFKTDGTEIGTVNVLDYAGESNSITWIENLNGTAIMGYIANGAGRELYKSDGITANSGLLSELFVGTSNGVGTDNHKAFGNIFFQGNSGTTGFELWKTDGTAAGTALVKEILSGTTGSVPKRFVTLDTNIYFNAVGANGAELWKSDGTAAGTIEVVDINPGAVGSNPDQIASINGAVYYFASDNGTNYDLYKFNGTSNIKLFDFNALGGTVVTNFVSNGTLVYFAADSNADAKRELWQTDGTAAGTVAVASLNPASVNAVGVNFITAVGNKIFFSAEVSDGVELFLYNPAPLGNVSFNMQNLSVYPNPTAGIIYIENNLNPSLSYKVFDILGKNILNGNVLNNQVEINVAKGVYFLELSSENSSVTKKIIKN